MSETWEILLVDDEPDIHEVTQLALKHKKWRKRRFNLTSAYSRAEAEKIILERKDKPFQVGLIDVVMESNEAGLDLCKFVRATCPHSFRIVLRTGQPGVAPEEFVLNEYDIDYYLAKVEATPERLFAIMRACLRSSEDISTLLAYGSQLQNFSRALRSVSAKEDLLVFMREGLNFLELKHGVACLFLSDLSMVGDPSTMIFDPKADFDVAKITDVLLRTSKERTSEFQVFPGEKYELPGNSFIIPFHVSEAQAEESDEEVKNDSGVNGGLYVQFVRSKPSEKDFNDFFNDVRLFVDNWRIAASTLRLQMRLARETMLREKMYFERMQSIAQMVAGVAHEMNTPIGVATTANSMMVDIVQALSKREWEDEEEKEEMATDLLSTSDLLGKNLDRAKKLVSSFKQLSSSQLADHKAEVDIRMVLNDCVTTMGPEARKHNLTIEGEMPGDDVDCQWDGYASYLTQVIVNLIQNALRYAYPQGGDGGKVDLRLKPHTFKKDPAFLIEFEDYGNGVKPDILSTIFEPFVTSARGKGGTGLGLSISHNIVTNMLKGKISVTSKVGEGTKFTLEVPKVVPVVEDPALAEMRRLKGIAGDDQ